MCQGNYGVGRFASCCAMAWAHRAKILWPANSPTAHHSLSSVPQGSCRSRVLPSQPPNRAPSAQPPAKVAISTAACRGKVCNQQQCGMSDGIALGTGDCSLHHVAGKPRGWATHCHQHAHSLSKASVQWLMFRNGWASRRCVAQYHTSFIASITAGPPRHASGQQ